MRPVKVLLIPDILVGRKQHLKARCFSRTQQFPLPIVSQPYASTTLTVWPESNRAIPRGQLLSKEKVSKGEHGVLVEAAGGEFQHSLDLLAGDGKLFHHFIDRHAVFEIFENNGNRHASTPENPRPAHLAGYAFHGGTL